MKRFTVYIDWKDGFVEDTDEVVVRARTAAGATSRARRRHGEKFGKRWPSMTITRAWVARPAQTTQHI